MTTQPDWNAIAEKFDIWLPVLAPVGKSMLDALKARPGDRILDVGSGTGEPALSLARQMGDTVEIIGVDQAAGMAKVAQHKVSTEGLNNIHFQTMAAEALTFADAEFDKVICRFGVMLFDDPFQGLKEMYRVLKPGGRLVFTVWSIPERMPTMFWAYEVFKDRVPEERHPPLHVVTRLGPPGVLEEMIQDAKFSEHQVIRETFRYAFSSFDDYWDAVVSSDLLKAQYEDLPVEDRTCIRDEIALFAEAFVTDKGLVIPHEYLLAKAVK